MSSKPSEDGARLVAAILSRRDWLGREIAELRPKVDRLKNAEEEYAAATALLWDVLQAMDVHTSRNNGWEARMTWFLDMLAKKAARDPSMTVGELRELFDRVVRGAADFMKARFEKAFSA